jgi:flagellar hook-associated protein 3 FlgL
MTGVSDIGRQTNLQYLLRVLRGDLDDAQAQVSSGKKSTTIGGLGPQGASNAISFRNKNHVLDAYTSNLNTATTTFTVMDQAMGTIAESARSTLTYLRSQLQDTAPQGAIVSGQAQDALQNVVQKLNEQVNGKYVFTGDDIFNPPLNNQGTLNTNMATLVAGWMAGAPTPASVAAGARAVTDTNLGLSSTVVASGNISFRGDDNTDIDYTVKANQAGFSDVLRGLAIISNLPQPTTPAEQTNYWAIVNGAISLLDQGSKSIDTYQGQLGNTTNQVKGLLAQHSDNQATFTTLVGSIEDADLAVASTQIQTLQTQLQASYSVVGQVKNLSLVNYI